MSFFTVTEKNKNRYPDLAKICRKEDWAHGLCYHDIEGFAIGEDGSLYLLDECGNYGCVPFGRFRVSADPGDTPDACPFCGSQDIKPVFSECGAGTGIVEHLRTTKGVRCVCKTCGSSGPVVPIIDGDSEEDRTRLAAIMWNMALRLPKYQ